MPFSIYNKYDMVGRKCEYVAAVAVPEGSEISDAGYKKGKLDEGRVYKVTHTGDYRFLGNAWSSIMNYVKKKKLKPSKQNQGFEIYVTDPAEVAPKDNITELYIALR